MTADTVTGVRSNPYKSFPNSSFWKRSVSGVALEDFDPVCEHSFSISPNDKVATAGSCFAQHIAKLLVREGFTYLVTEKGPAEEGYGVFPARFSNIYAVRQLLQLFDRAYGTFHPKEDIWKRTDGRFIDPFRPRAASDGFASREELEADRAIHLAAVREMFETADVFIFTLGLTEAWESVNDGAVFPFHPNAVGCHRRNELYRPVNFDAASMTADLAHAIEKMRVVNPALRVVLTVSPVPLIATHEPRHVLVATTYSKAALRVTAEAVTLSMESVAYFPSYEIITGPQSRGAFFAEDKREVTPEGVAFVMSLFKRHYLSQESLATAPSEAPQQRTIVPVATPVVAAGVRSRVAPPVIEADKDVICDETILNA